MKTTINSKTDLGKKSKIIGIARYSLIRSAQLLRYEVET